METKELVLRKIIERLPPEPKISDIRQQYFIAMNDYDIVPKETGIREYAGGKQEDALKMFFVSKKIEGLSDKTLQYYRLILKNALGEIGKEIFEISGDDLKYYFAVRMQRDKVSKCTMDNERRVLRSVFGWLETEEYIEKNPVRKISAIKQEKRIKKAFSETELEKLRNAAETPRDRALIEFLYSTGARVSEVSGCNRSDIRGDEVILYGKGEKERIGYLNERAEYYVAEYLKGRTDCNEALFVHEKEPHERFQPGGIETRIREIGERAGVENCHPHRFRRTCATMALNRGMEIEQVQKMLGHEKIETTTIYAKSNESNVKESHRKYVT